MIRVNLKSLNTFISWIDPMNALSGLKAKRWIHVNPIVTRSGQTQFDEMDQAVRAIRLASTTQASIRDKPLAR